MSTCFPLRCANSTGVVPVAIPGGCAVSRPAVIAVRGRSRSGKTTLCEHLLAALADEGLRVAYIKRTHHLLDLRAKSSGRIWERGPDAMLIRAPDRVQLTLPPTSDRLDVLLPLVPAGMDVVLVESHNAEPYPTLLWAGMAEEADGRTLGVWQVTTIEQDLGRFVAAILETVSPQARLSA